MLGVAFAGNFSKEEQSGFNNNFGPGNQQRVQAAFFSGVFSVMGYISKVMERFRNLRLLWLNR